VAARFGFQTIAQRHPRQGVNRGSTRRRCATARRFDSARVLSEVSVTLDVETIEALGFGDLWTRFALVERRFRQRAYAAAHEQRASARELDELLSSLRRSRRGTMRKHSSEAERIEAHRTAKRDYMRRVRGAR
jgi:hypothetical protein